MKEWMNAREIAAEKLAGLSESERGIQLFAEREGWNDHPTFCRKREGKGGGLEYHYHVLPTLAQVAYTQRYSVVGQSQPGQAIVVIDDLSGNLTDREKRERNARVALLAAYETFSKGIKGKISVTGAIFVFCDRYNMGFIQVEEWVKAIVPSLAKRSIFRWQEIVRTEGVNALGFDNSKARRDKGLLETAEGGNFRIAILGLMAENPAYSAKHVRTSCRDKFGDEIADQYGEMKPMPSLRSFQGYMTKLLEQEKVALTKITDPDRFRSHMQASGNSSEIYTSEPNELWMIDASPMDALCTDGRHSIYVCIDIATRRIVIIITKTPRAAAVAVLMRKAIIALGAPRRIKTDNGSDFLARATKQLFDNLKVDVEVCPPYTPEQKGHVERAIGTFQHDFAVQVPGYIGSNVAERKQIEGRKAFNERLGATEKELFSVSMTAQEMQVTIDEWVDLVYHRAGHAGLQGKTPKAVFEASSTQIRRIDPRALDVLLMPIAGKNGVRVVSKRGINIGGHYYGMEKILPGRSVLVRQDPNDLGRALAFCSETGEFITEVLCPEFAGIHPQTFWKGQKQIQADYIREHTAPIAASAKAFAKGPSGIERTLRVARRDAEKEDAANANVVQFPKPEINYETPAIAAALDAVTRPSDKPYPLNEKAQALHEAIVREAEIKAASNVVQLDPEAGLSADARMFKWALSVEADIIAGRPIDEESERKLASFRRSVRYQVMKDIMSDFGLEAALRI